MEDRSRSSKTLIVLAALLAALALVLPALALIGALEREESSPPETVLRIGLMTAIDSLNPHIGLNEASGFFYGLVYDSLQAYDEDLNVTPNLARDWRMVPESDPELIASGAPYGSVWEYNLTINAKWHDGESFTAEDVEWNLNLNCLGSNITDAWTYIPYTYFMKYAEVIDADTVRVHFYDRENGTPIAAAYGDFLPIYMLPRHLLSDEDLPYISFQWPGYFSDSDPKLVGTGPFKVGPDIVSEYAQGDQITLVRNPDYHWATDKDMEIKFDKLIMYFYDDDTAMKIALEQGILDVAQFPSRTYLSIIDDLYNDRLRNIGAFSGLRADQGSICIRIDTGTDSLAGAKWRCDVEARRALAQAVNRTHIANFIYNGTADADHGLFSPLREDWHWTPDASQEFEFDLTAASSRLEAAGYVDTDSDGTRECTAASAAVANEWCSVGDELSISMSVPIDYPQHGETAQYLEAQWAQIGVDVVVEVTDNNIWPSGVRPYSWYPETIVTLQRSEYDPCYLLYQYSNRSFDGWSFDNAYTNPSFEQNYTRSISELDHSTRTEYVSNCAAACYRDVPAIVIAYLHSNHAWRTDTFKNWGNWDEHPGLRIGSLGKANALLFNLESTWERHTGSYSGIAYAFGIAFAAAAAVVVYQIFRSRKSSGQK